MVEANTAAHNSSNLGLAACKNVVVVILVFIKYVSANTYKKHSS